MSNVLYDLNINFIEQSLQFLNNRHQVKRLNQWIIAELASTPEFKSQPEGKSESEFLLEWSVLSYTPVKEFKLEVAERGYNSWR